MVLYENKLENLIVGLQKFSEMAEIMTLQTPNVELMELHSKLEVLIYKANEINATHTIVYPAQTIQSDLKYIISNK